MSLIASVALGAALGAFAPLVLVTGLAHREATLMASHKWLTIISCTNFIPTNFTNLGLLLPKLQPFLLIIQLICINYPVHSRAVGYKCGALASY